MNYCADVTTIGAVDETKPATKPSTGVLVASIGGALGVGALLGFFGARLRRGKR